MTGTPKIGVWFQEFAAYNHTLTTPPTQYVSVETKSTVAYINPKARIIT